MDNIKAKIKQYYSLILQGDYQSLEQFFHSEPRINTPQHGEVVGRAAFMAYVKDRQQWLNAHNSSCDIVSVIETENRIVVEVKLLLTLKEPTESDLVELPVSVTADIRDGKILYLRSYHSTLPLSGTNHIRKPILRTKEKLEEPEVIQNYFVSLRHGSEQEILNLFSEKAYIREPIGDAFVHQGKEEREVYFQNVLAKGGVQLKECTTTFDGKQLAVEYVCDQWGRNKLEPQAGMAIYELDQDNKISAVRIYDDIAAA
ncbi:nuclear transport factor 2 family protein [Sediminitomix flava]|uniref:SnoaL-like protein n=1 Tax=Sediminitomix flava TaxID=379075 RepID=A0A315ZNE5_SEDFL|nr:nuclear transport factor 2 family protein [Sediminitomix flava]PWJ36029.1 SnoaL-like protein [Sediminitomix flava]